MKLFVAPGNPLSPEGRALIAGSQEELLRYCPPDEIFTLTADELAETPGMTFFIARTDRPLGCVASLDCGDYVEVKRLFVRPEGRGKGVARALMARLEDEAIAAGKDWVRLETGPALDPAIALYRSIGYSVRGPFGDYPEHPASLFMEKRLPGRAA